MNYPWGENLWDHPDPLYLSFSSRRTLKTCARKFEFVKTFNNILAEESMEGEVGKALHAGYQSYLIDQDIDKAVWEFMSAYPIKMNMDYDDGRGLEASYACLLKLITNVKMVEYRLAEIVDIAGNKRPAVEVEFEIWLDGPLFNGRPIVYIGFIDAVMFNILTGEYKVFDIKTTRKKEIHLAGEFKYHGQCLPYGLVIAKAANVSIERFNVGYISAYIDILEPTVKVADFTKTRSDIEEWFTNLYFDVKAIIEYQKLNFFPRAEDGCMGWKHPCQFLEICKERDREKLQPWLDAEAQGKQVRMNRKKDAWVRFTLPMVI